MTLAQQLVERILGPDEALAAHRILMQMSGRTVVLPGRDNVQVCLRGAPRWFGQSLRMTRDTRPETLLYSFWFAITQEDDLPCLAVHYSKRSLAKFGAPPDMAALYWDVLALILARPVRTRTCLEVH